MIVKSREDWLSVRARGIGASESAAILGVSPWKSGLQLFYEKKGLEPLGAGESFARTLGLALEGPIADLYRDETKRVVFRPQPGQFDVMTHATIPQMLATLDGRIVVPETDPVAKLRGKQGVLEVKTAAISKAAVWREEPPIDYQVQVQHQLAVTGFEFGVCVALIGGVSLKYADIKRDPEFIELLEAAVTEWWRRFELNDPPPPDGTEGTKEFLKRLYGKVQPTSATLGPDAIEWDNQREQALIEIKRATSAKLEAENHLKVLIGENVQGLLPNGVVFTWKEQTRKGYTVEPTTFRDFRRRGTREEKLGKGKKKAPMPELSLEAIADAFDINQAREEDFDGGSG